MSAPALAAPGGRTLTIRGTPYPVLLPTIRDPRLHLASVIVTLQVLGQAAFDFRVSIAQILLSLGTCALLEVGIAFWRQHVLMWPASALITGNGVAFILRVPGTQHGDWWSLRGWWIFVGTAAVSLLSKYVIRLRGGHIFNPSNIGLLLCFLILGESRAEPLDFWWGPMSTWMALALIVIVAGGLTILSRLHLLVIAVAFWLAFAAGIGLLAATGHAMTARWHVGPVTGPYFWWILVTSPEILVFLFFMITDPKTTPKDTRARAVYAVSVGLLAALLIAPTKTEFWAKVAVLGALAIVTAARPLLALLPTVSLDRRKLVALGAAAVVAYTGAVAAAGIRARPVNTRAPLADTGRLPQIKMLPSRGVQSKLDLTLAQEIAGDLVADLRLQTDALSRRDRGALEDAATFDRLPQLRQQIRNATGKPITVAAYRLDRIRMWLEAGHGQGAAIAVIELAGTQQLTTYTGRAPTIERRDAQTDLHETLELQKGAVRWLIARVRSGQSVAIAATPKASPELVSAAAKAFAGVRLTDVAKQVGLDFRQDDFHFGMSNDVHSMMGGGLCWLDYNDDGRLDLFVVNSYSDADAAKWAAKGGLPRSALFENVGGGRFVVISAQAHADPAVQGNGCVAGDLNGDGHTDLFVTTNTYNVLLWNNGDGTFTDGTHAAAIDVFGTFGWHTGAAVSDVNGDGRPDIFVSGYADVNAPSDGSRGFPLNYQAFRDLLYLNEGLDAKGHSRFRDVSLKAGIETKYVDHSLGAVFTDVNGDGRPDLYVANDLDPNRLYVNEPGGPLGFHFTEEGGPSGVADPNAGMGVAAQDYSGDGRPDIFVTNSRGQGHAAFQATAGSAFTNVRSVFAPAVGPNATGWGDSWVDVSNDGRLDLVLANGSIPVTNLKRDAAPIQVLENLNGQFADASPTVGLRSGPLVNGRGVAAADYDNDGRMDIAVNSIGGRLILLHNTGATGHWLEVSLAQFAPGALVTAKLPNGTRLAREVQAGSSYLSSEDPRVHFGLGKATKVKELIVRWPNGTVTRRQDVAADQVVVTP